MIIDRTSDNADAAAIHVIEKIPLELPERAIYARLGRHRQHARLSKTQKELLDTHVRAGFSLCQTQGRWRCLEILEHRDSLTRLQDGTELVSTKLARLLEKSGAVVLFAATAGAMIADAAAQAAKTGDGVRALVYDAVGSETADAAADWLQRYLEQWFRRHGKRLTRRRFSPGYGDWGVENQKIFYNLLGLHQMGVELTTASMLIPEKTVTAIVGIEAEPRNRA